MHGWHQLPGWLRFDLVQNKCVAKINNVAPKQKNQTKVHLVFDQVV
jgi:hypothetical protein